MKRVISEENKAKMAAARAAKAKGGALRESVTHTVRTNKKGGGGRKTIEGYTKGLAIRLHCTECLGFEGDPKDCTSPNCALFPFRKKTYAAYEENDQVELTEESSE